MGVALAAPSAAIALPGAAREISSARGYAGVPYVAMNASGTAVAIWSSARTRNGGYRVMAATRAPGELFSAPAALSPDRRRRTCGASDVGVAADGAATAIWLCRPIADYHGWVLQAASRSAAGAWSAPVTLATDGEGAPALAVNAAGDAVVAWGAAAPAGSHVVMVATRRAAGAWTAPVSFGARAWLSSPLVAIDGTGGVLVAWATGDFANMGNSSVGHAVRVASRSAAGTWSAPLDLSAPGSRAVRPDMASDAAGDAIIAWEEEGDPSPTPPVPAGSLRAAFRPAGGSFAAPVTVSATGSAVSAGMSGGGVATLLWDDRGTRATVSASGSAGRDFSAPQALGYAGGICDFAGIQLWTNEPGDAIAAWTLSCQGIEEYSSYTSHATRRRGASFEPLRGLDSDFGGGNRAFGSATDAALDESGGAIVISNILDDIVAVGLDPAGGAYPVAELLTGLRVSPQRFRAARTGTLVTARKIRGGATTTVTLKARAKVRFIVRRAVPRRGWVRVPGAVFRRANAGAVRLRLTGRLRGHRLPPGRYELYATATAGDGQRATRRTPFRIVR